MNTQNRLASGDEPHKQVTEGAGSEGENGVEVNRTPELQLTTSLTSYYSCSRTFLPFLKE